MRISTEEAEQIKLNYGYAFYNDASEEETFEVTTIGSNQKQVFNQLQLADMIEARLEEIYTYVDREIRKMGYQELPGGFVLTGGTIAMPGSLELAQDLFYSNVRVAIPDYIGVREAQFTSGVGILQFAYRNAKIQGKELYPAVAVGDEGEQRQVKQSRPASEKKEKKKRQEERIRIC